MRSLTSVTQSHCGSRYNEPVLLLEIEWAGTETGHYAERTIAVDGITYSGVAMRCEPIRCAFRDPASEFDPLMVRLVPDNDILHMLTNEPPEGKPARLRLFFEGTTGADAVDLFSGHVGAVNARAEFIEIVLAGFFRKHDWMLPSEIVSLADFPKAHEEDVGKHLPIVFGAVPAFPTLRVRVGRRTALRGSILANDTTVEVDDTTGFPSAGTLLIEEEQLTYTGIDGNSFTGCSRGANATEAVDHLNRREVVEYMTDHIYLVAGHACKDVSDIRVAGIPVEDGQCTTDRNDTTLVPGMTLTTVTFSNRPRVRRYSQASRFLEMQFDDTGEGDEAVNSSYCYDTTLEGFATLVAKISGAANNDTLRIAQTTDVSGYETKYGEILKAFLMVEHFESATFTDDYLSVSVAGQTHTLSKPSVEDTAGGGGEVDIDHGHTHSITGEHTHTMTVKKQPVFTNKVIQTGGTTGGWNELSDIAGDNLNKSGYTVQPDTDRSLLCSVGATTVKGSLQKITFCCRRGETNMAGSFYLRFYLNGSLEKQYSISGTSSPQTWKSGWETIDGLTWDDLESEDTYIAITPAIGNQQNIRLFGAWFELEYLEQPDDYEGSGVKDNADVDVYSADNAHVINAEPISSTSVTEGVDITDLVANDWSWFNDREVSIDYNVVNSDDGVTAYVLHVWFEVEYAPFEEMVSDDVTCTVQGIETAGDGTGDLVENPADVIEHILVGLLDLDEESTIDSSSFLAARQSLEAIDAKFAFALTGAMAASKLLYALTEQSRTRLSFDSGKFRLCYKTDALGSSSRVIMPSEVLAGGAVVRHAGVERVLNRAIGYYSRDYRLHGDIVEKYAGVAISQDTQSQATYGLRETRRELFAIRDEAFARNVLDFSVARNASPVRRYAWNSFLRDVDLERGDVVEICDLAADLFKVKGEIVEASLVTGSGIEKRIDTVAFVAELAPYAVAWSVSGGTYIRLVDGAFYFVVRRELVARLSDGVFYIRGFVVGDQALPAAAGNPVSYDTERDAIAFALSDNTRVMEIDCDGNILLRGAETGDQALAFSGNQDEIGCDGTKVWFNIGSERVAEATDDGILRMPKYVIENCGWEMLYG